MLGPLRCRTPYSLGCRRTAGIFEVSRWNDFSTARNSMLLIRAFVFSESPTLGESKHRRSMCRFVVDIQEEPGRWSGSSFCFGQ